MYLSLTNRSLLAAALVLALDTAAPELEVRVDGGPPRGLSLAGGRIACACDCLREPLEYSEDGKSVRRTGDVFWWPVGTPDMLGYGPERSAQLSPEQLGRLRDAARAFDILGLAEPDGTREPATFGGAFHYSLSVSLDGERRVVNWTGDSTWSDASQKSRLLAFTLFVHSLCVEAACAPACPSGDSGTE